jgi:hypothetical protein
MKKTLITFLVLIASIFVFKLLLQDIWFLFIIPVLFVGIFMKVKYSFLIGFISGVVTFFLILWFYQLETIDMSRVSALLFGTVMITKVTVCVLGGILSGLAFHAGNHLKLKAPQNS